MPQKRGGVILRNEQKLGFTPVLDMINHPSSRIKLLTYSSLSGFMFTLDLDDADASEYMHLRGNSFTEPVTSYIFKFSILTDRKWRRLLPYKNVKKQTESPSSFFEEARVQQTAWIRSVTGGRPPICPPIANFSMFHNQEAIALLTLLLSKTSPNTKTRSTLEYLNNDLVLNADHDLGLIVMPNIKDSITLHAAMTSSGTDLEMRSEAMSKLIAKVVRLFVDIGIMHLDLHLSNALMYIYNINQDVFVDSVILDFGKASDITTGDQDTFFNADNKEVLIIKKQEFYDLLRDHLVEGSWDDAHKIRYMKEVMNYLAYVDNVTNQSMFPSFYVGRPQQYQMYWYESIKPDNEYNNAIFIEGYNILVNSVKRNSSLLLPRTIEQYISDGNIIELNHPIDSYYRTINAEDIPLPTVIDEPIGSPSTGYSGKVETMPPPPLQPEIDTEPLFNSDQDKEPITKRKKYGGKRKSRKTRKVNAFKKSRRSRKSRKRLVKK